jgi:Fe-Mn family superoxide dismutase
LPPLPFADDALAPHMSAETLQFHHGKHHKAYVDNLNKLLADSPLADLSLDELILRTKDAGDGPEKKIFNNAGQHWNHSFFWQSLRPGGGAPSADLGERLTASFGSMEGFMAQFREQGAAHFGSGWAWLVADGEGLEIMTTHNADLPLTQGKRALVCCDLWEHAYYIDYRNERPRFLDAFTSELINWDFAEANLAAT